MNKGIVAPVCSPGIQYPQQPMWQVTDQEQLALPSQQWSSYLGQQQVQYVKCEVPVKWCLNYKWDSTYSLSTTSLECGKLVISREGCERG